MPDQTNMVWSWSRPGPRPGHACLMCFAHLRRNLRSFWLKSRALGWSEEAQIWPGQNLRFWPENLRHGWGGAYMPTLFLPAADAAGYSAA